MYCALLPCRFLSCNPNYTEIWMEKKSLQKNDCRFVLSCSSSFNERLFFGDHFSKDQIFLLKNVLIRFLTKTKLRSLRLIGVNWCRPAVGQVKDVCLQGQQLFETKKKKCRTEKQQQMLNEKDISFF